MRGVIPNQTGRQSADTCTDLHAPRVASVGRYAYPEKRYVWRGFQKPREAVTMERVAAKMANEP